MQLIVDANILVAEALRKRGRALLLHRHIELFGAEPALNEARYEIEKRVSMMLNYGHLTDEEAVRLLDEAIVISASVQAVTLDVYRHRLDEGYWRIPRDTDDAPTIALALTLNCGIWTSDQDFFGCGIPVWSTETLQRFLDGGSSI